MASLPRSAVRRIACAVVAAEIGRWREQPVPPATEWDDTLPIGEAGLELDSIERIGALGALAEAFALDDTLLTDAHPQTVGAWIDWVMAAHAAGDARLTVRTSGSTGTPRPCEHTVADLLDEARFFATCCPNRRRVVALVPAHHLYGIVWTAVLPATLDVPVVARAIGAPLRLAPGDLVVAVPQQWQAILRLTRDMPADIMGVSSGGPLDDRTAMALSAAGLTRLVDIYGSSETSGIALREWPAAAYTLLPRWRWLAGADGDGRLADRAGRVHALPDHVERLGDRTLRPIGRRDGAVQVAGHNVWPERVADVLRAADGVAEATVRLHSDGRLKAFVVPVDGHDPGIVSAAIDAAAAARLTVAERPRHVRFGTALPRNAMGKLADWR